MWPRGISDVDVEEAGDPVGMLSGMLVAAAAAAAAAPNNMSFCVGGGAVGATDEVGRGGCRGRLEDAMIQSRDVDSEFGTQKRLPEEAGILMSSFTGCPGTRPTPTRGETRGHAVLSESARF